MLAFSVAYELELPGLFDVLSLSGLPVARARSAGPAGPLVVAGGPLTFSNPEPLEPFVDVLVQGEAEELIHGLLRGPARAPGTARRCWTGWPGPRASGCPGGAARRSTSPGRRTTRLPARSQILTPDTELRSMFLIEPERGCSRGCHYCVMRRTTNGGMRTVPAGAGAGADARRTPGGWAWWARR